MRIPLLLRKSYNHFMAVTKNGSLNEDFVFLKNHNKILVITFGGIKQGLGMDIPPFEFMRSLQDKAYDVIFLRDREQAYYHLGVKGIGKNIDAVVSFLTKIIDEGSYDLVVTLGNSMGGYAALLFGWQIKADVCIAISPRTFLDLENRIKYDDDRRDAEIRRLYKLCSSSSSRSCYDLRGYLFSHHEKQDRTPMCLLFFGENNRLDQIHSTRMMGSKAFHIFGIKDVGHDAAQKMRHHGVLESLISDLPLFADHRSVETLLRSIRNETSAVMPMSCHHQSLKNIKCQCLSRSEHMAFKKMMQWLTGDI